MRLMSTLTRVGLILLAGAMISVLATSTVWDTQPDKEITTNDLANSMLDDWALPLLVLGILMAMAMMGKRTFRFVVHNWTMGSFYS